MQVKDPTSLALALDVPLAVYLLEQWRYLLYATSVAKTNS